MLAIGDNVLSDEEIARIMASEAPLISLKGQWVEIDRDKLAATLALWKKAQQANSNGVPFHLGMRLLAGFLPVRVVRRIEGVDLRDQLAHRLRIGRIR